MNYVIVFVGHNIMIRWISFILNKSYFFLDEMAIWFMFDTFVLFAFNFWRECIFEFSLVYVYLNSAACLFV